MSWCFVCLFTVTFWRLQSNQTGLQAGDFHCPARVLPSLLPTAVGMEGRPGLYRDEWVKKSKPQQAPLCQSIKRSGGTAAALITMQTREGEGAPALALIKRHKHHRCKHIQCKRADMGVLYCARTITLVHADLHCHMKSVLFPLMPICVCTWGEVAQLHTALCCSVKFHHESHWRLSWFYQRCSSVEAVLFGNVAPHPVPPKEHLSLQWKIPRANLLFVWYACMLPLLV